MCGLFRCGSRRAMRADHRTARMRFVIFMAFAILWLKSERPPFVSVAPFLRVNQFLP